MIRYPVRVDTIVSRDDIKKVKGVETYRIVDAIGHVICVSHNEVESDTIANALNAMNESSETLDFHHSRRMAPMEIKRERIDCGWRKNSGD